MSSDGENLSENDLAQIYGIADEHGRVPDAVAARLLAQGIIRTVVAEWTAQEVKTRLREAAKGIEKIVGRIGPKFGSGFWPDPSLYADATMADRNSIYQGELDGTRAPPARGSHGAGGDRDISRMEQAIRWPWTYLAETEHDDARLALRCWLWCEARNENFQDQFAELGCSRPQAYRRRARAFEVIKAGLIRDGIAP